LKWAAELLATLAMVWNLIYNAAFDRLWPVSRVVRTLKVRALHAIGFESGFILIGVTAVALILGVSLIQAFMLEIGFMLFFLPYTMLFNWVWDTLRERTEISPAADPGAQLTALHRRGMPGDPPICHPKLSQQLIHKCGKLHSFFWFTVDKVA
jgi:hypothetical protein